VRGPRHLLRTALPAALLLAGTQAGAHSFGTGTDAFEAFVEGTSAVLFSPLTLLPCLSLGLLLTLWQAEGMLRAWPALFAAHVAGFVLAPGVGAWVGPAMIVLGAAVAILAALLPRHTRPEAVALALAVGAGTMLLSLEGHGWLELSLPIHLGIFVGASFAVTAGAGIGRVALEQLPAPWSRTGLRIAASWLAAIQLLMAALLLAG
jgi:hypothetical protein